MIIFCLALLISLIIGWLTIITFTPRAPRGFLFDFFLSLGLGLGLCSQITFYSFLLFHRFNPPVILSASIGTILFLSVINRETLLTATRRLVHNSSVTAKDLGKIFGIGLLLVALFHRAYTAAINQPAGQWDAWAVWNMKTKFLIFGGDAWTEIFNLHWHTQPDYPLLLPFIHTWLFAVAQKSFNFVPALTAILFTGACIGLLYAGLARYIPSKIAALSAFVLLVLPTFQISGTHQYADIILSYYLLAGVSLLTITLKEKDKGFAVLSGMVLGLMCFTKNEGMVMTAILMMLTNLYLGKKNLKITAWLWGGLLLTLPPTIILKFVLAPPNRDMGLFLMNTHHEFLNIHGVQLLFQEFWKIMADMRFTLIWPALLLLFCLQTRRYFDKETKILTLFFIFYLASIVLVYLTTAHFDLQWRLSRTMARLLLTQLPGFLFLTFYVYWRKEG